MKAGRRVRRSHEPIRGVSGAGDPLWYRQPVIGEYAIALYVEGVYVRPAGSGCALVEVHTYGGERRLREVECSRLCRRIATRPPKQARCS